MKFLLLLALLVACTPAKPPAPHEDVRVTFDAKTLDVQSVDVFTFEMPAQTDVTALSCPGQAGCYCNAQLPCMSGDCIGSVCAGPCNANCPAGYSCEWSDTLGADRVMVCLPQMVDVLIGTDAEEPDVGTDAVEETDVQTTDVVEGTDAVATDIVLATDIEVDIPDVPKIAPGCIETVPVPFVGSTGGVGHFEKFPVSPTQYALCVAAGACPVSVVHVPATDFSNCCYNTAECDPNVGCTQKDKMAQPTYAECVAKGKKLAPPVQPLTVSEGQLYCTWRGGYVPYYKGVLKVLGMEQLYALCLAKCIPYISSQQSCHYTELLPPTVGLTNTTHPYEGQVGHGYLSGIPVALESCAPPAGTPKYITSVPCAAGLTKNTPTTNCASAESATEAFPAKSYTMVSSYQAGVYGNYYCPEPATTDAQYTLPWRVSGQDPWVVRTPWGTPSAQYPMSTYCVYDTPQTCAGGAQ